MIFHDDAHEPSEREFDRSLRPTTFDEFVGQEQLRDNFRIAITAARARAEPLDHVLLCGPPGLGKTTLAHLIAHGMGSEVVITSGPALAAPRDLAGTLTRLSRNQVLFVDEIHRLPNALEEYLYSAMEDQAIDVILDSGPRGRSEAAEGCEEELHGKVPPRRTHRGAPRRRARRGRGGRGKAFETPRAHGPAHSPAA